MTTPVILLNDTAPNRHHGCHLVSRQIEALAKANGLTIVARCPVGGDWRQDPALVAAMAGAAAIIVNGEGTLHSDKPRALPLVEAATFGRDRGIPTFLLNSIWQGNGPAFMDHARAFTRIWVRESASRDELAGYGIAAEVVPDLTLSSEPPPPSGRRHGILLTDSNIPEVSASLYRLARQDSDADWLSLLTPPTSKGLGDLRDWLAWAAYSTLFGTIRIDCPNQRAINYSGTYSRLSDVLALVARARLLVTGRFHAVCFALLTETPFVSIPSSSRKIEAMLADAGLGHRVVAHDAIGQTKLEPFATLSPSDLAAARQFRASARQGAQAMFAEIARYAGGGR